MNKTLVENIELPDDEVLKSEEGGFRGNAKELVTGVANEAEVEFVVDNLQEAVLAAHTDFCCNDNDLNYFLIDAGTDDNYEMTFDLSSLKHIFGVFGNIWEQTGIYNQLLANHPGLQSRLNNNSLTWLDKMQLVFNPNYKSEIINHECSESNASIDKLNWQKIMIKIFSLINVGLLETGDTYFYKEIRNKNSQGSPTYLLVRSLRNGELENVSKKNERYYDKQLIIKLVEEYYNGQKCLKPVSIYIVNKPLKRDGKRDVRGGRICLDDYGIRRAPHERRTEYKYQRIIGIQRLRGNKYAKKGNR